MFVSLLIPLFLAQVDAPPVQADVLIRGVTLHDGSGKPGVIGDLAIRGERIVGVGAFKLDGQPGTVIDGKGWIACPGFIDLHTHCDTGSPDLTQEKGRPNLCYQMQGVTTVVTGNCGSGPVDVASYFGKLEKGGVGTNVIHLAPHNSIRRQVMGNVNRPPSAEELAKMEALVDQAMRDGAWGLATGLIYNPGTYAKTDEIIALARMAAKHGGIYASHIRDESTGLLVAIEEAITIGKEAKLPVHISHIKASGRKAWGKSAAAIALIEKARAAGLAISADQYPYVASSTSLSATVVPTRFREGTATDYVARFKDETKLPALKQAIEASLEGRQGGAAIRIARYRPRPQWQGKTIAQIADAEKKEPIDIVIEIERNGGAQIVNFGMSEEDVRLYMKQPFVATASDGSTQIPGDTVPHPRSYGTFPRKIGFYAITEQVLPVEQAIRSASGLPADILGLKDRGYLRVGAYADVVLFDPATFRDVATFDQPHQLATGLKYLFVNGQAAITPEKRAVALYGKVLRHPAR